MFSNVISDIKDYRWLRLITLQIWIYIFFQINVLLFRTNIIKKSYFITSNCLNSIKNDIIFFTIAYFNEIYINIYEHNIILEEKMSLNPSEYKLSDRVGKLTAYGKFLNNFFLYI